MLEFIRSRAQGIFAWIIILLITIPFALWGIQEYLGGGRAKPAATVDGTAISQAELQRVYMQQRQRMQQMLGKQFKPEFYPESTMKPQLLQQLIERELLVQAARDAGMRVGDQQLAGTIRSFEAFQENGKFSPELYRRFLSSQGMSPGAFEARVRRDLLVEQLQRAVTESEFVTAAERQRQAMLINQQRKIGLLTFDPQQFADQVKIADEQIADYYEKNKQQFVRPEQVKVAYIDLSVAELAKEVKVTEDQVRTYYEAHKSNYRAPEERQARHILFKVEGGKDKQALEEAQKVRKQILSGEISFAEAAKKYSDDPGSADKGGDLGFFGRKVMDPAFEKAAFSLEKGAISEPVRSSFGYHLIQVEAVRGGKIKPLEEVKGRIEQEIKRDKARERFYDLAERLANLTYEHPDTLELAAEELGLKVQQSDYFSRQGGSGIAANPKVVSTAFSEEVLERGNNSDTLELGPDRLLVERVVDRKPEAQRPLDEVKEQITARLRNDKQREVAREAAEQAMAALRKGEEPKSVAEGAGTKWQSFEAITRDAKEPARAIVSRAFEMPHPSGDKPEWDRVTLPSGGQAVVGLYAVTEPEQAKELPAQKRQQLEQAYRQAAFDAYVQELRAGADITVNERGQ